MKAKTMKFFNKDTGPSIWGTLFSAAGFWQSRWSRHVSILIYFENLRNYKSAIGLAENTLTVRELAFQVISYRHRKKANLNYAKNSSKGGQQIICDQQAAGIDESIGQRFFRGCYK
jgi:hypothetical protein